MKQIKTQSDLDAFKGSDELLKIIQDEYTALHEIKDYDPASYGYIIIIEYGDTAKDFKKQFGRTLEEITWDGLVLTQNIWIGLTLYNNQFGFTVIIPNADWLSPRIRNKLKKEITV